MQRLEVSCGVQVIYTSLGAKGLIRNFHRLNNPKLNPASKNKVYIITFEVEIKILKIYSLLFMSSK